MITDEKLKTIVDDVIKDNEESIDSKEVNYKDQVYTITKKIIDLPSETITTIANLINYNPNETYVEPLTQGQIRRLVEETCKKLNIELEENRDGFGGLAYCYQFKKVNNDKVKAYMEELINNPVPELSEEDKEFEKYCKLYEERFGKKAYVAEPSGTKEKTIEAIKVCLEKNEDLLDKILYPNFNKNMESGILYSETKKDINNDKFVWKEGEVIIAKTQCEFCKHNDKEHPSVCSQYPNGKPNEVINNNIKCPRFDKQNRFEL